MCATVSYNGSIIEPAPFVDISVQKNRNENDGLNNVTYNISISGHILACKGSPKIDGSFGAFGDFCEAITDSEWTDAIMAKFGHITRLFMDDYKKLVIENASEYFTCYPKLISENLSTSDHNPQYATFTLELEAHDVFCGGVSLNPADLTDWLTSYDEQWEFSYARDRINEIVGDNRIYDVSHTISAQGLTEISPSGVITRTAFQVAKEYVCERITKGNGVRMPEECGLRSPYAGVGSALSGDPNVSIQRNYIDVHTFNEQNASYSVTESWTYCDEPFVHNYTINHDTSAKEGCESAAISGSIIGFDKRVDGAIASGDDAFTNAKTKYLALKVAGDFKTITEDVTGLTLSDQSESSVIGYNKFAGSIDYNYAYKERPSKLIPSAKSEDIIPSYNWDEDLIYTLTFIDKGEVVRRLNTTTNAFKALTSSLSISAVYPCGSGMPIQGPRFDAGMAAEIQAVVDLYHPSTILDGASAPVFTNIYVEAQNDTFDRNSGLYSYSVTWKYNYDGVCDAV